MSGEMGEGEAIPTTKMAALDHNERGKRYRSLYRLRLFLPDNFILITFALPVTWSV